MKRSILAIALIVLFVLGAGAQAPTAPADWPPEHWTAPFGLELVRIPAGRFEMGAGPTDLPPETDTRPRHAVRFLGPFLLGRFEVTVGQFESFVRASGTRTEAETGGGAPLIR